MNDNAPSSPSSKTSPSTSQFRKRRYDKMRLPTPPPDPTETKPEEEDFLAYIDSLQKSNFTSYPTTPLSTVLATETAFNHVEKLYKIMEQMLDLREQNARLQRKVRDLEHMHNLKKLQDQLSLGSDQETTIDIDKDSMFAEAILESILSETKSPKSKLSTSSRLRQSITRRQRNRSGSNPTTHDKLSPDSIKNERRASCVYDIPNKSEKVSKWTKVKAAFKWEKASLVDAKTQAADEEVDGVDCLNIKPDRYLRVPSTSDDTGHSPDLGTFGTSTPGTISSLSSMEDLHRIDPFDDYKHLEDEQTHSYIPSPKDDSPKAHKFHMTPWTKMKNIIPSKSSFKKIHRLSSHSDDIQMSTNSDFDSENVFVEEYKTDPPMYQNVPKFDLSEVPESIVTRYRQIIAEDGSALENDHHKHSSKWRRVKKAFLASNGSTRHSKSAPSLERGSLKAREDARRVEQEIQTNYRQLQKKLSLEFHEKQGEWEKIKQNSPVTSNPSSVCEFADDNRDSSFMKRMEEWQKIRQDPMVKSAQLTRREQLPPQFRKKLQEWEKIRKQSIKNPPGKKKNGETGGGERKSDHLPIFEYPHISEDFRKKLEEWKRIKSSGVSSDHSDKTCSPQLSRDNSAKKYDGKSKISPDSDSEQKRTQDGEDRPPKSRSSGSGRAKKEVLIHTPSGFYRFEGISRKFTQKLYEWEKAQGIGPESSTFALLNSSIVQDAKAFPANANKNDATLIRSKSADSIAISTTTLICPLLNYNLSSLSLNNVDDLKQECMMDSKSSSMQFGQWQEPEALIVEVEDIVEETAAPLHIFSQRSHRPVYQTQVSDSMCGSESCKVTEREKIELLSVQSYYRLIEETCKILDVISENELEIEKIQEKIPSTSRTEVHDDKDHDLKKICNESQIHLLSHLTRNVAKLQAQNSNIFSDMDSKEVSYDEANVLDLKKIVEDALSVIVYLTKKLSTEVSDRNVSDVTHESGARSMAPVIEITNEIRKKMADLKKSLAGIADAVVGLKTRIRTKSETKTKPVQRTEGQKTDQDSDRAEKGPKKDRLYTKSETSNVQSQGAVRKKIRYRHKSQQSKSIPDTDDEEENPQQKEIAHVKQVKPKSGSEHSIDKIEAEKEKKSVVIAEAVAQTIIVPTETNFVNLMPEPEIEEDSQKGDSPVTVFVKTTRKLFTPLIESGFCDNSKDTASEQTTISEDSTVTRETDVSVMEEEIVEAKEERIETKEEVVTTDKAEVVTHLPPMTGSPTPQRKVVKDISPSIRLMLNKYNQQIAQKESIPYKSGNSSGSASPVAWRSPVMERRIKAQTAKYLESVNKLSAAKTSGSREVQKSASVGYMQAGSKSEASGQDSAGKLRATQSTSGDRNILKSSSATTLTSQSKPSVDTTEEKPKTEEPESPKPEAAIPVHNQTAKQQFLQSPNPAAPPTPDIFSTEPNKFRNRLSQISMDSEYSTSDCSGVLIKSASAGMINIDSDSYKHFHTELHGGGYVSLPRSTKNPSEANSSSSSRFTFSNIASKFRKVKMRRKKDKDPNKTGAVSALCRQSLVVDISSTVSPNDMNIQNGTQEKSEESLQGNSPTASVKKGTWLKKPKLFHR